MKLDYLLRGTIRKEDVASAFLATAFEQSARFRRHLLGLIDSARSEQLAAADWTCGLEERRVDVTFRTPGTIVIVENKVRGASKQPEQLARYYRDCSEAAPTGDRVLAVYVAPKKIGESEVSQVNDLIAAGERPHDRAVHVSWHDLAAFRSEEHADREIVAALGTILRTIDELKQPKYLRENDRDIVATLVDAAADALRLRVPSVPISRWTEKALEQIMTNRTNITMWLDAVFEAHEDFTPKDLCVDESIRLDLRVKFKLAGHVKMSDPLRQWWDVNVAGRPLEITGLGLLRPDTKGWYTHVEPWTAPPDVIQRRMVEIEELTIRWAEKTLDRAGASLLRV